MDKPSCDLAVALRIITMQSFYGATVAGLTAVGSGFGTTARADRRRDVGIPSTIQIMKRCSERIEIELIHPEQAVPILDRMGFTNYQVTDKSHIHIFERLNESANVNMELAKAGILVNGISITSEELE